MSALSNTVGPSVSSSSPPCSTGASTGFVIVTGAGVVPSEKEKPDPDAGAANENGTGAEALVAGGNRGLVVDSSSFLFELAEGNKGLFVGSASLVPIAAVADGPTSLFLIARNECANCIICIFMSSRPDALRRKSLNLSFNCCVASPPAFFARTGAADPEDAGKVGTGRVGIANNGLPVGAAGAAVVVAPPKVKPANALLAAGAGAASALAAFHFLQRVPFYLVNNVSVAIAYTQTMSKRYERFLTWMF